jgi:3-deoxy-manno-octulosonate cytidylyltransferase (CMP-KDO synthetase)
MNAFSFTILVTAPLNGAPVPELPLADIEGAPLVVRIVQRLRASRATRTVVLTDSDRVLQAVHRQGAEAVRVADHGRAQLGPLAEGCAKLRLPGAHAVVAVSVADLFIAPRFVDALAQALRADPQAGLAVGACPVRDMVELLDPRVVKVVFDDRQRACYASRAPVPWPVAASRHADWNLPPGQRAWRCLTSTAAYRVAALVTLANAPVHALEHAEELEVLRAIGRGHPVSTVITHRHDSAPIDSEEDLEMARAAWLAERGQG